MIATALRFKFFADESEMPVITNRHGSVLELPLVATSIETRLKAFPRITLELRARHLDFVTCSQQGWPEVMFEGEDLVSSLLVSKVEYVSGQEPGDGVVKLTIELGEHDTIEFS